MNEHLVEPVLDHTGKLLGTAFPIVCNGSCTWYITCQHVLPSDGKPATVNKVAIEETLLLQENEVDLVLISTATQTSQSVRLASPPANGTAVVIGYKDYSGGRIKACRSDILFQSVSICKDTEHPDYELDYLELVDDGGEIESGFSGAPVVDSKSDSVIGVVIERSTHNDKGRVYALSFNEISRFLPARIKSNLTYSTPNLVIEGAGDSLAETNGGDVVSSIDSSDPIEFALTNELNRTLAAFEGQPSIWVLPEVHLFPEGMHRPGEVSARVEYSDIIKPKGISVIHCRKQFGATTLARFLCLFAYRFSKSHFYYLDASRLRGHDSEIRTAIKRQQKLCCFKVDSVDAVIVDSVNLNDDGNLRLVKKIGLMFPESRVIIVARVADASFFNSASDALKMGEIRHLHLWALTRNSVRSAITQYNDESFIAETNRVTDTVLRDLEALNLPRTPIHCLTFVKIYDNAFDDSPANRADVLHRVLFMLFNGSSLPDYKTKPDVKDAEYTLGWYCSKLLRENNFSVDRDKFIKETAQFCKDKEIEIDTSQVFDTLYTNHLIEEVGGVFRFRMYSWLLYFAAQWMDHDEDFAAYVLAEERYFSYPEIIEFYTGIDRKKSGVLKRITEDLHSVGESVRGKCSLPENFSPFGDMHWSPSAEGLSKVQKMLTEGVQASRLPDVIKDNYADLRYNRSTPLDQEIKTILEEYSVMRLMRALKAASRALRNSDFVDKSIRHDLLREVLAGYSVLVNVLVSVAPAMLTEGRARIEGANFTLIGIKDGSPEERLNRYLSCLPDNLLNWYEDELFSNKMSPLLHKHSDESTVKNSIERHLLQMIIARKRPSGWVKSTKKYIAEQDKNSYYLYDMFTNLAADKKYAFVTGSTYGSIDELLTTLLAKHKHDAPPSKRLRLSRKKKAKRR